MELPGSLEDAYLQALARLPEMSVILYPDPRTTTSARIYVPVEPCDPFTEAVRTALEIDAEVVFLEPDSAERPHLPDTYPDTYSIRHIGLERYIEAYRVYPQPRTRGSDGARRGHGLEAAGRRSAGASVGGGLAESAGSVAGCDGGPAGSAAAAAGASGSPAVESASRLPGRDHRRISLPAGTLRIVPARDATTRTGPSSGRECSSICCARPKAEYIKNTGEKIEHWQRRMMARYHAQSGVISAAN